jgi:histidinol-phosphate aminotransferase
MKIHNLLRDSLKSKYFKDLTHEKVGTDWINLGDNENKAIGMDYFNYPSHDFSILKEKYLFLLRKIHVDLSNDITAENILFGPGSDYLIDACLRTFSQSGNLVSVTNPTFFLFEYLATLYDLSILKVELTNESMNVLDVDFIINKQPKIIFICQPNNPIGNRIEDESILYLLKTYRNGLIFIDEAYQEFDNNSGYLNYINKFNNLVISRTFSKALGGAGIRLGALFANQDILTAISKAMLPYAISTLTKERACFLLDRPNVVIGSIEKTVTRREMLLKKLKLLKIFRIVHSSFANFIFVEPYDLSACRSKLTKSKIFVRYYPMVASGGG